MHGDPAVAPLGIAIIGAGGHGAVVLDALLAGRHDGPISVHADSDAVAALLGHPVTPAMPTPDSHPPARWQVHVAIGDNGVRARLSEDFVVQGYALATIRHPASVLSPFADIAPGTAVLAGAVVNPRASIGRGAILNTNATVEHDCTLGDWCHVSPGAVMAGDTHCGARTWLGAGAVLRPQVRLGYDITVGANATVVTNLTAPGKYVGSPARPLNKGTNS